MLQFLFLFYDNFLFDLYDFVNNLTV